MSKIKIFSDIYKLSRAAAEFFVTQAKNNIKDHGHFSVALSGGGTPESLYALLATDAYRVRVSWDRVHFFWGDERCVPPDHIDSNYRMAYHAMLKDLPIPEENIHRIPAEKEPEQAAQLYESALRKFFGRDVKLPRFDLILLGMGNDGHTASLFPHSEALKVRGRWVYAQHVEDMHTWRVTLTPEVINAATAVAFFVSGEAKAARVKAVLEGAHNPDELPAQLINPTDGELYWLLDEEASALLSE